MHLRSSIVCVVDVSMQVLDAPGKLHAGLGVGHAGLYEV
jgi:hypothetical protein